jgi:hypothetical protein
MLEGEWKSMVTKRKINKNKKTAWELLNEIPNTPEQRRIDREIKAIEKKYEEKNKKNTKKLKTDNVNKIKKRKNIKITKIVNFGFFAGKIWNTLNIYGPLEKTSLINNTKLKIDDFYIGIGWLARENKISKEMNYYKLDKTNLTYEIGENAGKIWKFLDLRGAVDLDSISKYTYMKKEETYSAIGWLSRENKIKFYYKNNQLVCELN